MSAPTIIDVLLGKATLITGVEQDDTEPDRDRVYLGPRYHWIYALVEHGAVQLTEGHTFTTVPDGTPLYQDTERVNPAYLRPTGSLPAAEAPVPEQE